MRLDARLKRLEAVVGDPERGILLMPDDGTSGETEETIRLRWEYFLRNARPHDGCNPGIVIIPAGDPEHANGERRLHRVISVVFDPNFYGNVSKFPGIDPTRRVGEWTGYDASGQAVIGHGNGWYGEHHLCPPEEESFEDFLRWRAEHPADDTGTEQA
jgi:hypothetical protein